MKIVILVSIIVYILPIENCLAVMAVPPLEVQHDACFFDAPYDTKPRPKCARCNERPGFYNLCTSDNRCVPPSELPECK